jgi:sugar lactone lactonase YvrE
MAPHGLSVREGTFPDEPPRVALVLHQMRDGLVTDALQFFDVVGGDRVELRWTGCVPFPDDAIGNDVAWLPDGSLVATNYAPRGTPEELDGAVLRGALGFDTGDVLHWSKVRGWTHVRGTESAIPNGIAVAADGHAIYFADAGNRRVAIVPVARLEDAGPASSAVSIERVDVGGAPDNLSVTASGTVLATVATLGGDLPLLCGIGDRRCRGGWAVWEVDPAALSAREILADDGRRLATATSALEVGNLLYVGSMADDRLGVYRRP